MSPIPLEEASRAPSTLRCNGREVLQGHLCSCHTAYTDNQHATTHHRLLGTAQLQTSPLMVGPVSAGLPRCVRQRSVCSLTAASYGAVHQQGHVLQLAAPLPLGLEMSLPLPLQASLAAKPKPETLPAGVPTPPACLAASLPPMTCSAVLAPCQSATTQRQTAAPQLVSALRTDPPAAALAARESPLQGRPAEKRALFLRCRAPRRRLQLCRGPEATAAAWAAAWASGATASAFSPAPPEDAHRSSHQLEDRR